MISNFYLGATLVSATTTDGWATATLTLSVKDWEGVNIGTGVLVNDLVWIDTSAYQSGTVTEYKITSISSKTAASVTAVVSFVSTNHSAPDLSYSVGSSAIVGRPTSNRGLMPLVSPDVQKLPPRLCYALINRNNSLVEKDKKLTVSSVQPTNPQPNEVWLQV